MLHNLIHMLANTSNSGRMYRNGFLSMILLCFFQASSWGTALPSPKDIEAAVVAGRYSQAESMLREVIREKPLSAKAHYELGEVLARENQLNASRQELLEAQRIDPSLKFAQSPDKFKSILETVSVAASNETAAPMHNNAANQPVMRVQEPTPAHEPFPWGYVVIAICVMLVLGFIIRRMAPPPVVYGPAQGPYGPMGQGGPVVGPSGPPGYGPSYGPGYGPAGSGSGIGGAVVGGLAGVAAGYALSRAMEGGEHGGGSYQNSGNQGNSGYIPMDQPRNAPDIGSFDQGSGSGWDDSSSGGGSDDSGW